MMSELPANRLQNVRRRAERAMDIDVTCPASRHVMIMADSLAADRTTHQLLEDEPKHCAQSLYATLESLWKLRATKRRVEKKTKGKL